MSRRFPVRKSVEVPDFSQFEEVVAVPPRSNTFAGKGGSDVSRQRFVNDFLASGMDVAAHGFPSRSEAMRFANAIRMTIRKCGAPVVVSQRGASIYLSRKDG